MCAKCVHCARGRGAGEALDASDMWKVPCGELGRICRDDTGSGLIAAKVVETSLRGDYGTETSCIVRLCAMCFMC